MVIAHHLVWTAYGTWLPNDPRGSGSHTVVAPALAELGPAHHGRKKAQPPSRVIRGFYENAEPRLVYPVIRFDALQIATISEALAEAIRQYQYTCYAAAVMPDHVHLVIRKHRDHAEEMIAGLQAATRLRLSTAALVPKDHPVWTLNGWHRFLTTPDHVHNVIRYVEENPTRAGLPRQTWPFVIPYNNWPFHRR
ncbi:MAG TPA: transposase [Pirellulales bacterium]|jgi:REP element-mobilizing transposase RayT|nr:transposase [Pirellulales bacterium]